MLFSLLNTDIFDGSDITTNAIGGIIGGIIVFILTTALPSLIIYLKRLNVNNFYDVFLNTVFHTKDKKNSDWYHFLHYVKHSFIFENPLASQKVLSYKAFIKEVKNSKTVILLGSAGTGKSILMQRLALKFHSKMPRNKSGKSLCDYGIIFRKLNRTNRLDEVISEIKGQINAEGDFSLFLDGLDELSDLSTQNGSEILNKLLDALSNDAQLQKLDRIFISLRPEILNSGYSSICRRGEENISVFKIKNFNAGQIMAMYRNEKHDDIDKTKKLPLIIRKHNRKKLKALIKSNPDDSIFTFPLILTWANEILYKCSLKELERLSWYDALGIVIDNELTREYRLAKIYDSCGAIATRYPPDEFNKNDEFILEGKEFLANVALNMALSDNQRVTREDISKDPIVQKLNELLNETTGNTPVARRLLRYIDWSEKSGKPYYEFLHNTIYWRTLAETILNPNTPQTARAKIILNEATKKYSTPLMQYCYQGLWTLYGKETFPYIDDYYLKAVDKKSVVCNTKNKTVPLEIVLSCFYGFDEIIFDYSFSLGFAQIKKFVEERKLNLSNTPNVSDLTFLENFGNDSFDFLDCSNSDVIKAVVPDYVKDINFSNCTSLTNITLPYGITRIRENALFGCCKLTSLTIPESVKSIGDFAFQFCHSLTHVYYNAIDCDDVSSLWAGSGQQEKGITVTIGASVTKIPKKLFDVSYSSKEFVPHFTSIIFEKNSQCKSIGNEAFSRCSKLTSIILPESVKSIEGGAFKSCTSLSSIIIPDGVTSIRGSVFKGCTSLTSIVIPDGVTSIEPFTFKCCISLSNIVIPNSVTSIGHHAFESCTSLSSIVISDSVTNIEFCAFKNCTSLLSIVIPDSVTNIGEEAFAKCSSLKKVTFTGTVEEWNNIEKVNYIETKFQNSNIFDKTKVTEIICKDGIIKIEF